MADKFTQNFCEFKLPNKQHTVPVLPGPINVTSMKDDMAAVATPTKSISVTSILDLDISSGVSGQYPPVMMDTQHSMATCDIPKVQNTTGNFNGKFEVS